MKKKTLIRAVLTLTFLICSLNGFSQNHNSNKRWDNLIKAISVVESKNNPNAVSGKHVGILQISPITVDECNRILKLKKVDKKYTYRDRYCERKSIEMFNVIQDFYNEKKDIVLAIKLWNTGPSVLKTHSYSKDYLRKVMKEFNHL